jgi:hypothetical protein
MWNVTRQQPSPQSYGSAGARCIPKERPVATFPTTVCPQQLEWTAKVLGQVALQMRMAIAIMARNGWCWYEPKPTSLLRLGDPRFADRGDEF